MAFKKYVKLGVFSALLGAIAGLFLAKKSGQELRQDIKQASEDLKLKAEKVSDTVSVKAKETVEQIKEDLETPKELK